jgi:hypothetical protein
MPRLSRLHVPCSSYHAVFGVGVELGRSTTAMCGLLKREIDLSPLFLKETGWSEGHFTFRFFRKGLE